MAFIREYGMAGDPWRGPFSRGDLFKKLKKRLKPSKGLRKLGARALGAVKFAAPFVPGIGTAVSAGIAAGERLTGSARRFARDLAPPDEERAAGPYMLQPLGVSVRAEDQPRVPAFARTVREAASVIVDPEEDDDQVDDDEEPALDYRDDDEEE